MAQWIARWTSDPEVVGSSPTLIDFSRFFFGDMLPISWEGYLFVFLNV